MEILKNAQAEKALRVYARTMVFSINKAIIQTRKMDDLAFSNIVTQDNMRQAKLKDIATALGAYYADREKYPDTTPSGCINAKELNGVYMPKGVPTDPIKGRLAPGCDGTDGMTFAYRT